MPSIINATTTTGLVSSADNSGSLQLATNNGTTAVTIDTSQRVGVNATDPATFSSGVAQAVIERTSAGNNTVPLALVNRSGTTNTSVSLDFNPNTNIALAQIRAFRTDASFGGGTDLRFLNYDGSALAERMRINSDGNISVNSTSNSVSRFAVNQTATGERCIAAVTPVSYGSACFRSLSAATAGTGWYHLFGTSSSDTVSDIIIYGNGNVNNTNGVYGSISDVKLKENITDATPKLDKLMQVKVRNYNFKGSYEQHKQLGVIAQELETVFPGLIEETQDRGENDELLETTTKSVKYSVFVPMLIKAMQEQQAMIQELKAELDATKAEVAALKGA